MWRVRTEGTGVAHGKDVVFSYMDGERWKEWLKTMYGIKGLESKLAHDGDKDEEAHEEALDDVQIVIADHKVGRHFLWPCIVTLTSLLHCSRTWFIITLIKKDMRSISSRQKTSSKPSKTQPRASHHITTPRHGSNGWHEYAVL